MSVWLLGIRHHGPGSARSVVAALEELQPDIVLIESPAETTTALSWIGRGLRPPVAMLGYVVDHPQRGSFIPFAEFSPEWQAVLWANNAEIPVEAIDLPLRHSLAVEPDDAPILFADGRPADPIGALAEAAGQPDAERWWDDVIEHRGEGLVAFEAVADAMAAVRHGALSDEGELRREAFMRKSIRAAVATHPNVVVVCGAWHVPALDLDSAPSASSDAATLRGLPRVKVAVSWVPWTHRRLARSSGYGAGVASPGWYDHIFSTSGDEAVPRFFVDAARVLRSSDLAASPDDVIAATRLTGTLAALRDRPRPGLDEVLDGADAVFGGLKVIKDQLVIGDKVGSVPDGAPQVPLARDLAKRQKSARLKLTDTAVTVELDLRTPNGRRRSHLLHQLRALGIGWGSVVDGRGSSGTFRETWSVRWSPEYSVLIVERSAYGTTVEAAATRRLIETAETTSSVVELANILSTALLADLGDAVAVIVGQLETRAARDPDIVALMAALAPLADAQRYGDVRDTDVAALRSVFDGVVVRVLAGLVGAARSLDDDAAASMVEQLGRTQHALSLVDHPARRDAFPDVLTQLAERGWGHGLVQGRATRLLHDADRWSVSQVGRRLSQALSGGTKPQDGAAFVEGFVAGSGTVLLHDQALRDIIDQWLSSLKSDAFEATIPLLRRTFSAFSAAERSQLARLLAGEARHVEDPFGGELDPIRVRAAMETVAVMLGARR